MDSKQVSGNAEDVVSALQNMHRNQSHTEEFQFISRDGKQQFSSHQLILAIHSYVLKDMIYGPSSCKTIKIEDVDNCAIENLIRHCYAEDLVFDCVSDVIETKIVADKFQIFELGRICVEKLSSINVNLSNLISVLKTSIEFNNAEKETECLLLINEHKEEVFTSEQFTAMKFNNVLEIFEKLRDRNFLTEFEFLHSAIKWLGNNERSNEGKEELMNKIDVSRISLNEYVDIVISFPEFFSIMQICDALNLIRSNEHTGNNEEFRNQHEIVENLPMVNETKFFQDAETNTEETDHTRSKGQTGDNQELRNQQEVVENQPPVNEPKFYLDAETNTEETDHTRSNDSEELRKQREIAVGETKFYQDAETNTDEIDFSTSNERTGDNEGLRNRQEMVENQQTVIETQVAETQSTVETHDANTNTERIKETAVIEQDSEDSNQLNININKEIDGVNVFQWPRRVKFSVKHNWKNGPCHIQRKKNDFYTFNYIDGTDIFFEGIYNRFSPKPEIVAKPMMAKTPDCESD